MPLLATVITSDSSPSARRTISPSRIATSTSGIHLGSQFIDRGLEAVENAWCIGSLRFLGIPKVLGQKVAVLLFEFTDNLGPGHAVGIRVNLIMESEGLDLEREDIPINETCSDNGGQVAWSASRSFNAASQIDNLGAKQLNVLTWLCEKMHGLELCDERAHCRGANLLYF
jgi:hypothetical protein